MCGSVVEEALNPQPSTAAQTSAGPCQAAAKTTAILQLVTRRWLGQASCGGYSTTCPGLGSCCWCPLPCWCYKPGTENLASLLITSSWSRHKCNTECFPPRSPVVPDRVTGHTAVSKAPGWPPLSEGLASVDVTSETAVIPGLVVTGHPSDETQDVLFLLFGFSGTPVSVHVLGSKLIPRADDTFGWGSVSSPAQDNTNPEYRLHP